jgi:hypothetical protein
MDIRQQWEYTTFVVERTSEGTFETSFDQAAIKKELEAMGAFGWELVTLTPIAEGTGWTRQLIAVLKRPANETE